MSASDETFHTYCRRRLPHWRLAGATYFVTFRLVDSVPASVISQWNEEYRTWYAAHGLSDDMTKDEWQDAFNAIPEAERRAFERKRAARFFLELDRGHGECLLRHPQAARIVADALWFHHGKRLNGGDFVIMPNHVHWLLTPLDGNALEEILQSVKRFSATQINHQFGRAGKLWQKESHDHIVRDEKELLRIRAYIKHNPEKALLKPNEYLYYCAED